MRTILFSLVGSALVVLLGCEGGGKNSPTGAGGQGGEGGIAQGGQAGQGGVAQGGQGGGGQGGQGGGGQGGAQTGGSGGGISGNPYALDPDFNGGNVATTAIRDSHDASFYILPQQDGKLIVSGVNYSNRSPFIARFEASGAIDTSFGIGGRDLAIGRNSPYMSSAGLAPDGKIAVGINLLNSGGAIARYDASGNVDTTFGKAGRVEFNDMFPYAIGVQSDGKIVAVGGLSQAGSNYPLRLRRFLTNGDVDTSFGIAGTVGIDQGIGAGLGGGIAFDSTGRIIVPGAYMGTLIVRRFTSNGALDTSFNGMGIVESTLRPPSTSLNFRAFAIQADDKILLGGKDDNGSMGAIWRFTTAGKLDTTFDADGMADVDPGLEPEAIAVAPGGQIYLAAATSVYRFTSNGAVDAAFGGPKVLPFPGFSAAYGLCSVADGSVYITGPSNTSGVAVAHLNADGSLDATFGTAGKIDYNTGASSDEILGLAQQPDGKIIAAGRAEGTFLGWVATRYTASGALDTSFGKDGKLLLIGKGQDTRNAFVDSAGRILLTGGAALYEAARFTANGVLDPTYGTAGQQSVSIVDNTDSQFVASALDKNERLVMVGHANNSAAFGVVRLTANGQLDTTFAGTGKLLTPVGMMPGASGALAVALQSDGKIVAAGSASILGGYDCAAARYLDNGALDPSFGNGGTLTIDTDNGGNGRWEACRGVAETTDGKLVFVGNAGRPYGALPLPDEFWNYVGDQPLFSRLVVVRTASNGMLDASFGNNGVVAADFGYPVVIGHAVRVLEDGRIYAAGQLFDGATKRGFVVRLQSDGTFDTSFAPNGFVLLTTGEGSGIRALSLQADGKLLIGGQAFVNPTGYDFALLRLTP